ncbi:MAG: hypothetical protein ACJAZO_004621 [Myxococcota bacterium]|jgi:hypothetical protein
MAEWAEDRACEPVVYSAEVVPGGEQVADFALGDGR